MFRPHGALPIRPLPSRRPGTGSAGAIALTRLTTWMYRYRIRRAGSQTLARLGAGKTWTVVQSGSAARSGRVIASAPRVQ